MNRRQLPPLGVLVGLALLVVSTRFYPGGTLDDPATVGFDWTRNYITQLLRPVAVNGHVNAARPYAVAGLWLFCVGIAVLFWQLSRRMSLTWHGKWVEISGIATTVYAALAVTRMHDLMIGIALTFFLIAEAVTLHWLWRGRQLRQWIAGMTSLAVVLIAAIVYYGGIGTKALPTLQKLSFVIPAAWLLWLHRLNTVGAK